MLALGALLALVASVLIWAAPGSQAQTPPNLPPVAVATLGGATSNDGPDNTAGTPDDYMVQTLVGSRSFDPDADSSADNNGIAVYRWEVVTDNYKDWLGLAPVEGSPSDVTFNVPNEASIARYGQTIEFKLTVWDANPRTSVGALSDTDTVTYNFRAAEKPTADITVTALLPNPAAVAGYDDDGDGLIDEDDEQFTVDGVISRPGEDGNADYEWHIKEGALLTLDGSGSSDPDTPLANANFSWERVYDSGDDSGVSNNASAVEGSLPGGSGGNVASMMKASTSSDNPQGTREAFADRVLTKLVNASGTTPNAPGTSPQPFYAYYRLTVDDNGTAAEGGNTDTADVLIIIEDQPSDPVAGTRTNPITATVPDGPDDGAEPDQLMRSSLGANRFLVTPGRSATMVTITAKPSDADGDTPRVSFAGARATAPGAATATLTVPSSAPQGTEYEVNITVTDVTKRSTTTTVTIVAVRNTAPEAVAPANFARGDGPNGGDIGAFNLPTGTVALRGIGFDADGDDLTFSWTELSCQQLLNTDDPRGGGGPGNDVYGILNKTALSSDSCANKVMPPRVAYLSIDNADQETASFAAPEVDSANLPTFDYDHDSDGNTPMVKAYRIPVSFTVTDKWGQSTSSTVTVTIYDNDERKTVANAGANQQVTSGSFVRLNGSASRSSAGTAAGLTYEWTYTGITTDPLTQNRPAITDAEVRGGYVEGKWFPYDGTDDPSQLDITEGSIIRQFTPGKGLYHPTAGGALKNWTTRFPYFDAPRLHGFNSIKLHFDLKVSFTPTVGNEQTNTAKVTITVSDGFYSGNITGPDFCTGFSLGGPQTAAFDSDGDGVADICSLRTTRREAVATQNALNELAALNPATFKDYLHGKAAVAADPGANPPVLAQAAIASQCKAAPKNLGDSQAALDADACGPAGTFTRRVSSPPPPVDLSVREVFFSGIIDSEAFCTNRSLGGQPLYANDSDGDGVADICSLGYTRREAVARQNALQKAFSAHAQFAAALAQACAELGTTNFGDSAASLANDRCSKPKPSTPGTALPTPPASGG